MSAPILIPTRGRIGNTKVHNTWRSLSPELRERAYMVCPPEEADAYRSIGRKVLPCPVQKNGLSAVLQWIQDYAIRHNWTKIFTCDDDLRFLCRRSLYDYHATLCSPAQVTDLFLGLERALSDYLLVGVSHRRDNGLLGAKQPHKIWEYGAQQTNVFGTRPLELRRMGIRYDEIPCMQDRHVTLAVLESGHLNAVWFQYAQDDAPPGMSGGCALYRDFEMLKQSALRLRDLHPRVVKLVWRKTADSSGSWKGMERRIDVSVKWKEAYRLGLARKSKRLV